MNNKYMDFVPVKSRTTKKVVRRPVQKVVSKPKVKVLEKRNLNKSQIPTEIVFEETRIEAQEVGNHQFTLDSGVELGVIEDLNPKFVRTDVPKRPLSRAPHFETKKSEVVEAKAKKVGVKEKKASLKSEKKGIKTEGKSAKSEDKKTYKMPKSPFINQNKVEKRPLSKNVYHKKIEAPKEEAKGPVTIIAKPDKDAHVGLIIAVILTIILGAAAGTVAFLLLPK